MALPKIFIVGGTGAQGLPVIRALSEGNKYALRVLTRDKTNYRSKEIAALPNVELLEGTFSDDETLRKGYEGCYGAWVNINGFAVGEMAEIYWGIRAYELAVESGVKFYVMGNLDYGYKKGGYDPKYRCGHYDGKGRVSEWILTQPRDRMNSVIFTTGPYLEMAIHEGTPMAPRVIDDVVTWAVPLGEGAVPHITLDDVGYYVRWIFDNQEKAIEIGDLEVATEHVHYKDLAEAFSRVTGKPAQYIDLSLDTYFANFPHSEARVGKEFSSTAMSVRQNFAGFWNLWKYSGKNEGVVRRDYKLLDEIHPRRIRSAEEWFRKQDNLYEKVLNLKPVLKGVEDGKKVF